MMVGGALTAAGVLSAAYVKKNEDEMECAQTKMAAAAGGAVLGMAMMAYSSGMSMPSVAGKVPSAPLSIVAKTMAGVATLAAIVLAMEKHSGSDRVDAEKEAMLATALQVAVALALVAPSGCE